MSNGTVSAMLCTSYGEAIQTGATARDRCGAASCSRRAVTRSLAQQSLERRRLLGPVDEAELPVLGELPREQLGAARGVRLVDEAEVGLEPVEHARVGAEQGAVGLEQRLERRAPPGELQLGGDLLLGDVAVRQIGDSGVELEVAQRRHQLGALLEVVQHVALGGEALELLLQLDDADLARGGRRRSAERRSRAARGLAATCW